MQLKTLISIAIAGAFAASLAQAADDKATSGASGSAGAPASGAEKMFTGLDKNKDGYLSREEVAGSPHAKDFDKLDKNGDGKLSPDEHAAAPEHAGDKASSGGTTAPASPASGGASSETPKKY
jgi:hypothetical protein